MAEDGEERSANTKIFISYGREPGVSDFVKRMKRDLESNGFTVWLDTDDISVGCDWRGEISEGVSECLAFVPVLTAKYLTSSYCNKELDAADVNKKKIFPILYENVDFSTKAGRRIQLIIGGIQYIKCRPKLDDYSSSVYQLMLSIKEKGVDNSDTTIKPPPKMLALKTQRALAHDSAGETLKGLQAGRSWQELHLVSMGFMIDRRWQHLHLSVAVKLAELKRLLTPSTILQPGDRRNGGVGAQEINVGKRRETELLCMCSSKC